MKISAPKRSNRLPPATLPVPSTKPGFRASLNGIRVFEAAARHKSFKLAAAELAMTATAVSHQIKTLEAQLGVSLFERKVRKVKLTEQGETLYHASAVGLHHIQQAILAIQPQPNRLRVSTTSSFAALVLLPRLQEFYRFYDAANVAEQNQSVSQTVNQTSGKADTSLMPQIDISTDISTGENLDSLAHSNSVNGESSTSPFNKASFNIAPFNIAIRLGDKNRVPDSERLNTEHFNLYGTPEYLASLVEISEIRKPDTKKSPLIFTVRFKNTRLPNVPWHSWLRENPAFQHWLAALSQPDMSTTLNLHTSSKYINNALQPSGIPLQYWDQEMYGIQQAQAGRGLVFCSATLVNALPIQNLIPIYLPVQFRTDAASTKTNAKTSDKTIKSNRAKITASNVANFVASDLCYYLPEREYWQNASNPVLASFVKWLESLF